jgi:hypothetical protein
MRKRVWVDGKWIDGLLQRRALTASCEAGSREATATTTTTTLEGAGRKTENGGAACIRSGDMIFRYSCSP